MFTDSQEEEKMFTVNDGIHFDMTVWENDKEQNKASTVLLL